MPSTFLRDALFSHIIKPPFEWSSGETHSPERLPRSSGRACCCSSKVDLSLFKDHVTEIMPGACKAPLAAKATPSLSVGICSTGTVGMRAPGIQVYGSIGASHFLVVSSHPTLYTDCCNNPWMCMDFGNRKIVSNLRCNCVLYTCLPWWL